MAILYRTAKFNFHQYFWLYGNIFHAHVHSQLVYCLVHFTGDDKVPPYINRLIDPSIETEEKSKDDETFSSFYQDFDEEDYLTLRLKDPELLFQDNSYMKHLRRHANKSVLPNPHPFYMNFLSDLNFHAYHGMCLLYSGMAMRISQKYQCSPTPTPSTSIFCWA